MSSLDAGWFWLITNILIQSRDLAMIARWHQCGTMTSQMLARASFPPSVWPSSRSNFDLGPSPSDSTEKTLSYRSLWFWSAFFFNTLFFFDEHFWKWIWQEKRTTKTQPQVKNILTIRQNFGLFELQAHCFFSLFSLTGHVVATLVTHRPATTDWAFSRHLGLCALHHGIQILMEAILACHPARSTEWLDCHPKSCELWRIRTGPFIQMSAFSTKCNLVASNTLWSYAPRFTHFRCSLKVGNFGGQQLHRTATKLECTYNERLCQCPQTLKLKKKTHWPLHVGSLTKL